MIAQFVALVFTFRIFFLKLPCPAVRHPICPPALTGKKKRWRPHGDSNPGTDRERVVS